MSHLISFYVAMALLVACQKDSKETTSKQVADKGSSDVEALKSPNPTQSAIAADLKQNHHMPESEIVAALSTACKSGDQNACGWQKARESGVSFKTAEAYFTEQCQIGHLYSCVVAGWTLTQNPNKTGRPGSPATAINAGYALFEKACQGGEMQGCKEQGRLLSNPWSSYQKDEEKAAKLFKQACDAGDLSGCVYLGNAHYLGQGLSKNVAKSVEFYQKACDGGNAHGCARLAWSIENGKGITADKIKAINHYTKACISGYPSACANVASSHFNGYGVAVDKTKGVDFYQKACEGGINSSCHQVARSTLWGNGAEKNAKKALSIYTQNCEQGYLASCSSLATWYINGGDGLEADTEKALSLYRKACKGGEKNSCFSLSRRPEVGDNAARRHYIQKACDLGLKIACKDLKKNQEQ